MASPVSSSSEHRKLALIISNGNYSRAENKLSHSTNNANDLRDILQTIGFNVQLGSDLNKSQINTLIIDFSKTILEGDLVLVYFTGQSYQVDGENYFIPIGDDQMKKEIDIQDFAIHLRRSLSRFAARNTSYITIFILDCYRSYYLKNADVSASSSEDQGLCTMKSPPETFIQFACDANKTVGDRQNLFIKHFLARLTQENIHIVDLFEQVNEEVVRESKGEQRPLSMNGLTQHGQVYLNEVIISVPEPSSSAPSDVLNDVDDEDMEVFRRKQELVRSYYDQFPDIDDVIDRNRPDVQRAEKLTQEILSRIPSAKEADRDAACHVLHHLLGGENQKCLFFNSNEGMKLHDASKYLVDLYFEERPFVLKLNNCEGLGNHNYVPGENDYLKLAFTLTHAFEHEQSHPIIDDIRERLAKAHEVDKEDICLMKVYSGSFGFVYTVKDIAIRTSEKVCHLSEKLRQQFNQFLVAKIHPLLYRPSFDISQFDDRGNKDFSYEGSTFQIGPPGREKTYTQPTGWTRYGLKVLGVHSNDTWLHPFGNPGNWYKAYHGTGHAQAVDFDNPAAVIEKQYASIDAAASIHNKGFRPARVARYGSGVYCSPNAKFPEKGYVGKVPLDTKEGRKMFQCMLQVAVNPDGVNCATNDIWVVALPENIRSYGILIKEIQ